MAHLPNDVDGAASVRDEELQTARAARLILVVIRRRDRQRDAAVKLQLEARQRAQGRLGHAMAWQGCGGDAELGGNRSDDDVVRLRWRGGERA